MIKKLLFIVTMIITICSFATLPVYAEDPATSNGNCVKTSILGSGGQSCDDGKGSEIIRILNLIVNIMTIGIGILGVIGITVVGIQYLTAGGSEEQTRKAKRRMFEIVLGLAVYAVVYALLVWLLPGFTPLGS